MIKTWLRIFVLVIIFLATVTIISRLGDIKTLEQTLRQGIVGYLVIAFAFHILYVVFQAKLIGALFEMIGVPLMLFELVMFYIGTEFANLTLPTAGAAGMTVFAVESKRHGVRGKKGVVIGGLAYYINYITFGLILGIGLIFLAQHKIFNPFFVTPAIILGGIILFASIAIWLAAASPKGIGAILKFFAWIANNFWSAFGRKKVISRTFVDNVSEDIHEVVSDIFVNKKRLWKPFGLGLLIHGTNLATLAFVFAAFHYPVQLGIVVAGYAIAWLITIVSITPSGVGIVEGAMVLVLRSLSVPLEIALVVTVVYRAIVFWLPFLLGLMLFQRLKIAESLTGD